MKVGSFSSFVHPIFALALANSFLSWNTPFKSTFLNKGTLHYLYCTCRCSINENSSNYRLNWKFDGIRRVPSAVSAFHISISGCWSLGGVPSRSRGSSVALGSSSGWSVGWTLEPVCCCCQHSRCPLIEVSRDLWERMVDDLGISPRLHYLQLAKQFASVMRIETDVEPSTEHNSTTEDHRCRSRTVHWALDVSDSNPRPLVRTRSREESDKSGELWWSQREVLEFRRHRDRSLLRILREDPEETRLYLSEFSYEELKAAFHEDLRRTFMQNDDEASIERCDNEWMRLIDRIHKSWRSIHRLIRSRGQRLLR